MKSRTISTYSLAVFASALLVCAISFALVVAGVGGDFGAAAASDIGEVIVIGLAAVAILRSAKVLGFSTSVGRPWLLIGLGTLSYLIGDVIWTIIEIGMRAEVPYPGLPDAFYLLEYPLIAAGILWAGLAFRGLVPMKRPVLVAGAVAVVLGAVVYFGLLAPSILFDAGIGLGEKVLSALYPLGDVIMMIAPAAFTLAVVSALGGGRLGWQWWAVGLGAVLIAAADAGYSWLSAADKYVSGSFIDWGWSLGHALIMLGALIARDFARPKS